MADADTTQPDITQLCRVEHCIPVLSGETKQEIISELIETLVRGRMMGLRAAVGL